MKVKPLKKYGNEWRSSRGTFSYVLHPHREGIQVNYGKGRSELFSDTEAAESWIHDIHYPQKAKRIYSELYE